MFYLAGWLTTATFVVAALWSLAYAGKWFAIIFLVFTMLAFILQHRSPEYLVDEDESEGL